MGIRSGGPCWKALYADAARILGIEAISDRDKHSRITKLASGPSLHDYLLSPEKYLARQSKPWRYETHFDVQELRGARLRYLETISQCRAIQAQIDNLLKVKAEILQVFRPKPSIARNTESKTGHLRQQPKMSLATMRHRRAQTILKTSLPEPNATRTVKTKIHFYRFDLSKPEDAKAYKELCERLRPDHKFFHVLADPSKPTPEPSVQDIELELAHVFADQWNSTTVRVF